MGKPSSCAQTVAIGIPSGKTKIRLPRSRDVDIVKARLVSTMFFQPFGSFHRFAHLYGILDNGDPPPSMVVHGVE